MIGGEQGNRSADLSLTGTSIWVSRSLNLFTMPLGHRESVEEAHPNRAFGGVQ